MAAALAPVRGRAAPPATLLEIHGHDPYRLYFDEPSSGGWREMQDPVSGMKYWTHVMLRLTTRSLVELLRLNGLEEFLLNGEWSVFTCVPEDISTYEDLSWGLDLYANDRLDGKPVLKLKRGTVVASTGMPRPGVVEILVPSDEEFALSLYASYRFPRDTGKRVMQRLPASLHCDDVESLAAITIPSFCVLPGVAGQAGLPVTLDRDPRSHQLGLLPAGSEVFLSSIVGTRAQLSQGGPRALWGGWFSLLQLDGTPSLERVLPETENMQLHAKLAAHIAELEEQGRAEQETAKQATADRQKAPQPEPTPKKAEPRQTPTPPVTSKVPLMPMEQRPTVTGGWRQVVDPVWNKTYFVEPVAGRLTWSLGEVLKTGGLDDLLLSRDWEMCSVDPLAAEVMKDQNWSFEIFADPGLKGDPLTARVKGDMVIVQLFDPATWVAQILLHPGTEGEEPASGYARYRLQDGRPLLRAVLPPSVDEYAAAAAAAAGEPPKGEFDSAEPPPGPVLEGPYFATPPGGAADLPVTIGQDLGSERWARLPKGYCIRTFADVIGLRARLPDLEGGGWVSIFGTDGTPNFRKQPTKPPVLELPTVEIDAEDVGLPAVWPGVGVLWPKKVPMAKLPEQHSMPELLKRLGGGRAVCDWKRLPLLPDGGHAYKSPYTFAQTTLHDLLRLKIWKATFVEAAELDVREYGDPRSTHLVTLPRGSLVVAEWVAPSNAVRLLIPGQPNADNPLHVWADLGNSSGSCLAPLVAGTEFWVEPKGGHLTDEEQTDEDPVNITKVLVREEEDPSSKCIGYVQRGDAVTLAEIHGRFARVVHTRRVLFSETVAGSSGWLDVFDDAGWSILKLRMPGETHIEEIRKRACQEIPEEERRRLRVPSKRSDSKQSSGSGRRRSSRLPSMKLSVASVTLPGALNMLSLAEGNIEEDEEEEVDEETSSAGALLDLPPLLLQIGELEGRSVNLKDWREHRDPVWGRRYYVNKWSGQIIHKLVDFGISQASVRLTLFFTNLSKEVLRKELPGPEAEERLADIEGSLKGPFAALADVPEDLVDVKFVEGVQADGEGKTGLSSRSSRPEDSARSSTTNDEEKSSFRTVAQFNAPGTQAAWASAGLKRAMADADRFTRHVVTLVCSAPHILSLRVELGLSVELIRADLEELEIPRTATCKRPPPSPPAPPLPPIDDDIREMSRNMALVKPKLLQMPNRTLGPPSGNAQILAEGLQAVPEPTLEEVGLWKCYLGDAGAVSLANALNSGVGVKLHTLLLDENRIGAAGATSLGAALKNCDLLRELGIARNPLGPGFAALVSGLGAALVVFDASDASLDDTGVKAAAQSLQRWPALKSLRLSGNGSLGKPGLEALVRAAALSPSLRLADVKGCSPTASAEWPRFSRLLSDAGREPSLVRL